MQYTYSRDIVLTDNVKIDKRFVLDACKLLDEATDPRLEFSSVQMSVSGMHVECSGVEDLSKNLLPDANIERLAICYAYPYSAEAKGLLFLGSYICHGVTSFGITFVHDNEVHCRETVINFSLRLEGYFREHEYGIANYDPERDDLYEITNRIWEERRESARSLPQSPGDSGYNAPQADANPSDTDNADKPPFYKTEWFWTAVGVGATIAIFILTLALT